MKLPIIVSYVCLSMKPFRNTSCLREVGCGVRPARAAALVLHLRIHDLSCRFRNNAEKRNEGQLFVDLL